MQLNQMIYQMCHELLSAADVSAICKARGFNHNEGASRSTFENAFLSSTGLASAMVTLSPAETASLYLLKELEEPVGIDFFDRLYPAIDKKYWVTVTQQYRETLNLVKKQLVRKGVLVMYEDKRIEDSVQMERWRFILPPVFARFLPPLIANARSFDMPGNQQDRLWVQKVREALGGTPVAAQTATGAFQVKLENGTLSLGNEPLTAEGLQEWQQTTWEEGFPVPADELIEKESLLPIDAVLTILGTLTPGQWITPGQLAEPLKIFTHTKRDQPHSRLLQSGWKWGLLARLSEEGETYYRLAAAESPVMDPFGDWLSPESDGALCVNLERIPLAVLIQLNHLAHLSLQGDQLVARPDLVKLGKADAQLRQSALVSWLSTQAPAFGEALRMMAQRWGKVIIHAGLLVARVRDLSLRVQLERELKGQMVVLSSEFIAFPPGLRADVERVLKKSGFVVKEVKA